MTGISAVATVATEVGILGVGQISSLQRNRLPSQREKTRALRNHGREGGREKDASRRKCICSEKQNRFIGEKT